jgi:malonate-semialdehyde dehydrogenase (acetylating)/methylmalonate-semialdehyde dehydrogenase
MSISRLARIPLRSPSRSYATTAGLNALARPKAENLSATWKGTSATGGNTKNFIGGTFVDSKTTQWHDVLDPVCLCPKSLCKSKC